MATEVVIPGQKAGYVEGGLRVKNRQARPDVNGAITSAVQAVATQPAPEVIAAFQTNIDAALPLPTDPKPQG